MSEKSDKPYLDYKRESDPNINVKFNVKSEVIVHREEKIHIKIQIDHNLPEKTIIRFIIPYSWEPITLENNFCIIESSTEGYIRKTGS